LEVGVFQGVDGSVWSIILGRRGRLPLTIFRDEKLDASFFHAVFFVVTIDAFADRRTYGTDVSLMGKTGLHRMQHDKY